jgi:hypothetical protein
MPQARRSDAELPRPREIARRRGEVLVEVHVDMQQRHVRVRRQRIEHERTLRRGARFRQAVGRRRPLPHHGARQRAAEPRPRVGVLRIFLYRGFELGDREVRRIDVAP